MDVVVSAIVESLLIGLGFFYKALWPILLGVLITAAIETFVNEEKMAEILGGRDLLTPSPQPQPSAGSASKSRSL